MGRHAKMFSDFSWSIGKIEKKDHDFVLEKKKKLKKKTANIGNIFCCKHTCKGTFF